MQEKFFKKLLQTNQTVFSFKDLLLKYRGIQVKTLKSKLNYYVKNGDLYSIRRGFYAKDKNYDRFECATKIFTPAYISFESVLSSAGVIFQYSSYIFIASYQSRTIVCDGQTYIFKTIQPIILTNTAGVEMRKNYSIASSERAFLDVVYLHKEYHFDNLEPLNWEKVYEILPIYGEHKSLRRRVDMYYEAFKSEKLENA